MTIENENSKTCFTRLLQESSSPKFHKSLEHVRKACDAIEQMEGLINYSKVAKYTKDHFGNPRRQTIMNNDRLRLYIDLRKEESSIKPSKVFKREYKSNVQEYPSEGLDLKTKVYIDQLRARNDLLEKSSQYLNQEVLQATSKHPISYIQSISNGPDENLSMTLVNKVSGEEAESYRYVTRKLLNKLLKLTDNTNSYLEIQVKNGEDILVLETPLIKETILFSDELKTLRKL